KAWKRVTSQTIINCWKKTGILPDVNNNSNEIENATSILNTSNVKEI
ncbi:12923_t:CDS:2, partial [Entrophospora sp. SA101]